MKDIESQNSFIAETWNTRWDGLMSAQKDGMNWLFTLNVGGVAGMLTYASAKPATLAVDIAIGSFSIGVLGLVYFGLRYYYYEERMFYQFRDDVRQYRSGTLNWVDFVAREGARPTKYRSCEIAAWVSTGAAITGILASATAIL